MTRTAPTNRTLSRALRTGEDKNQDENEDDFTPSISYPISPLSLLLLSISPTPSHRLNKMVLIMFANDTMVIPRESSWFGAFAIGSLTSIIPMQQQPIFTQDWIGLQTLDKRGAIVTKTCPGDHMHITTQYFHDEVAVPFLGSN